MDCQESWVARCPVSDVWLCRSLAPPLRAPRVVQGFSSGVVGQFNVDFAMIATICIDINRLQHNDSYLRIARNHHSSDCLLRNHFCLYEVNSHHPLWSSVSYLSALLYISYFFFDIGSLKALKWIYVGDIRIYSSRTSKFAFRWYPTWSVT